MDSFDAAARAELAPVVAELTLDEARGLIVHLAVALAREQMDKTLAAQVAAYRAGVNGLPDPTPDEIRRASALVAFDALDETNATGVH